MRNIKIGILAVFILLQFFLIFVKKHHTLELDVYPNTHPSPSISGGNIVGQTFSAPCDSISRIEIMLGTFDRKNDGDIAFSLWGLTPEKRMLTEISFNASSVRNNLFNAVDFSAVPVIRGQSYAFELRSPASTPDNSICAWTNGKDIYQQGDYFYNDQITTGDLIFRVYSKQPVYKELERITRNYSGIFSSSAFLVAAIVVFESIQIGILVKLMGLGARLVDSRARDRRG